MATGAGVWLAAASPPAGVGVGVAMVLAAGAALIAIVARRPVVVALSVIVLTAVVADRAVQRHRAVEAGPLDTCGHLVVEARPARTGWRAEVAPVDGDHRLEVRAFGGTGVRLGSLAAGDLVCARGSVRPMPDSGWSRSRHLVGRWTISELSATPARGVFRRVVDAIRFRVLRGGDALAETQQPLYTGLVLGEDRLQPAEQRARFRAAGLSHLLAVSGQNVAFVLTATKPLVQLVPRRGRLVLIVGVLAGFAMATRLEPSVIRAVSMAAIGAWTSHTGRQADGARVLIAAVIGLILRDPFLVHAIGFQLSVAASAGIIVLAPAIERRLPGPSWLGEPLAVTVAAQLAVLPLQLAWFGPVSVVAVPANVAAGPAAGAVMLWGLTVGLVAGALPASVAQAVQLPAAGLVGWIDYVATVGAAAPIPRWSGADWLIAGALALAMWALGGRRSRLAVAGVALAVLAAGWPSSATPDGEIAGGGRLYGAASGGPSVLVVDADANSALLDAVLARRLAHVDVIVSESGSGPGADVARSVAALVDHDVLLAPSLHRIVGATRWQRPVDVTTEVGVVRIDEAQGRLVVDEPSATPRPRP